MKYVIFKGNGMFHPVTFSDYTTHKQISVEGAVPIAAGFVKFDLSGWPICYGESESLHLKSRGEADADIIRWSMKQEPGSFMFIDYNEENKEK